MDKIYDFTNDKMTNRPLGGTDHKYPVDHNGIPYMIKFPDEHSKHGSSSTSHLNSITSEYIGSHIAASIGMETHETVLGYRDGKTCVGCKDFRGPYDNNMEFGEYVRAVYDPGDIGRVLRLDQIYGTIKNAENIPEELKQSSIARYWDTFVIDALVGNFDRHKGNWGYIAGPDGLRLAPTYDYGSTLLPTLSDKGMKDKINDKEQMLERCLVFPSPALFIGNEKNGKPGYYDMLSSDYDHNCTEAVLRIAPRIDMQKISDIIDNTPMISDIKRVFYKKYIALRKAVIIDRAYKRCLTKDYDQEALNRIKSGRQYSVPMLKKDIQNGKYSGIPFQQDTIVKNNLIVTAGIPGAGKEIFAEKYIHEHPFVRHIRTNDIRNEISDAKAGLPDTSDEGYELINDDVFDNAYHRIETALNDAEDVIFVATNLGKENRKKVLDIADRVRGINKQLAVIYASPDRADSDEPLQVLKNKAIKLHNSTPDKEEGWDNIIIVGKDPYLGKGLLKGTSFAGTHDGDSLGNDLYDR